MSLDPGVFDEFATDYDPALQRGLVLSGEDKNYFAERRVAWIQRRIRSLAICPEHILDFGCGTGSSAPFLLHAFPAARVLGVDVSVRSIEIARRRNDRDRTRFETLDHFEPTATDDLAFCNGVFHHILPAQRGAALEIIRRSLRPGGVFAFWENNPWNLGTRLVMHRIPFDRDAIMVWPHEARRLLSAAGFEIVRTDYLFIFPRPLAWARRLEPGLARWPLGAQYLVLARASS